MEQLKQLSSLPGVINTISNLKIILLEVRISNFKPKPKPKPRRFLRLHAWGWGDKAKLGQIRLRLHERATYWDLKKRGIEEMRAKIYTKPIKPDTSPDDRN